MSRNRSECDDFLSDLAQHTQLSEAGYEHIRLLWPDAQRAADFCEARMPKLGWFSLKKRYDAFISLCEHLDLRQNEGMSDEQAQLVLTILRRRNRDYRKMESAFVARLHRLSLEARRELPLTAQQLIKAIQFSPGEHNT